MKKLFFTFLFILAVFTFMKCRVNHDVLNSRELKKCELCDKFLRDNIKITPSYIGYDKIYDSESVRISSNDSIVVKPKINMLLDKEYSNIKDHQYCFLGMKKSEIEMRFADKFIESAGHPLINENIDWYSWLGTNLGDYYQGRDSLVIVYLRGASFIFQYDIANGDTIFAGTAIDTMRMDECLALEKG